MFKFIALFLAAVGGIIGFFTPILLSAPFVAAGAYGCVKAKLMPITDIFSVDVKRTIFLISISFLLPLLGGVAARFAVF